MDKFNDKSKKESIATIIKTNRQLQKKTQRQLCENLCAHSHLSKIESGESSPSKELLNGLFERLDIVVKLDDDFLEKGYQDLHLFNNDYMFNEFDVSNKFFFHLEDNEKKYLSSEYILDYLIAKMAFNSTQSRKMYSDIKGLLSTLTERMSTDQKYNYYLCLGVDNLKIIKDAKKAFQYFELASKYGETGHINYWLGYYYLMSKEPLVAMKHLKIALKMHVDNANVMGMINSYDLIGLVHYSVSEYKTGIAYYNKALKYIEIANNLSNQANIKNQIAWGYMRLNDYDKALSYIVDDRYNSDITVNASVTKFLIAYHLKSPVMMDALKKEFSYRNRSLHRMIFTLLEKENFFDEQGRWLISDDEIDDLYDFAQFTHSEVEKAFTEIFAAHYIELGDYKRACHFLSSCSTFS